MMDKQSGMPERSGTGRGMARTAVPFLVLFAATVVLGGCGGFRDAVGLNKRAPDEFAVVSKAPLVIPPDYGLRPPRPGERRPQESSADKRASSAVFGADANEFAATASPGELALLRYTGAFNADVAIRAQLRRENRNAEAEEASGLVNRILFWRDKPSEEDLDE